MVHLVTYDLKKPGQSYEGLHEALKKLGTSYKHPFDSTWFIAGDSLSAGMIVEKLKPFIDDSDLLFVTEVTSDRQGCMPDTFRKWLRHNA